MTKVKNAITKPSFGFEFVTRFIVYLMIFMLLAAGTLELMGGRIESGRVSVSYRKRVGEFARNAYKAKCEGVDYEERLGDLKLALSIYQMVEGNYAEVHIGEETITVSDNAIAFIEGYGNRYFFIDDISYLQPVNEYMNGKFDLKEYNLWESKNQYELVYKIAFDSLDIPSRQYNLKSAYVDPDKRTFIPGIVQIIDSGKTYEVDCTPKDTKGYEYVSSVSSTYNLVSAYRIAPEKTSADVDSYIIPDDDGDPFNIEPGFDWNKDEVLKSKAWYVGYKEADSGTSVFATAPLTSACILILAVLAAALISLLISVIKYQKAKTIWKIFEYRTKTTEAMAHDLKTPMAAIAAYAESMESFAGDAEKTNEYSHKISEKIKAMDHMVEDILALSRNGSDNVDITAEEVNVMALVTESLEAFPDLKTNISGGQVKIKTDKKLFKQAVDNLLSNCDRYGEKGSTVDITIDSKDLTIANKTDEKYPDVESLKKPFVKGSESRSDKGTGLGLSIADNNLNILGYKLELVSEEGLFKAIVKFR